MEYKSRITNIGASKIAEAIIKGETINLVSIAAGDGGGEPYEPTGSETKLKNEVWRGKITGVEEDCTNGNAYNLITTIPQSAEGFFIRELAAYDSEGDCIAIANTPTIEKKGASTGVGIELTVNMQLIFENADQVNVVIAPLATKEITNRIGNTTDTGGSTTSGTVMGKLNKVLENEEGSKTNTEALKNDIASVKENVSSVKSDVAGVKADVSNVKTSVTAVSNKIGTVTDTNGSATGGTLMAKINKLIGDIATHVSAWTVVRAAKIDTINTNVSVIGKTADTGGSSTAGTSMAKLNNLLTCSDNLITSMNSLTELLNSVSADVNNGFYTNTCTQSLASLNPVITAAIMNTGANYNSSSIPYFAKWTAPYSGTVYFVFNMNCSNTSDGYTGSFDGAVFTTSENKTATEIDDATYGVSGNNYNHGGTNLSVSYNVTKGTTYYFFMNSGSLAQYTSAYVRCNALYAGYTVSQTNRTGIKSIQRGIKDYESYKNSKNVSVTISSVNTNKCIVLLNGAAATNNDSNYYGVSALPTFTFNSSTELYISYSGEDPYYRGTGARVLWQVIEFY